MSGEVGGWGVGVGVGWGGGRDHSTECLLALGRINEAKAKRWMYCVI